MKNKFLAFLLGAVLSGGVTVFIYQGKINKVSDQYIWSQTELRMHETLQILDFYKKGEGEKAIQIVKGSLATGIQNYELNKTRLDDLGYGNSLHRAKQFLKENPIKSIDY